MKDYKSAPHYQNDYNHEIKQKISDNSLKGV